MMLMMILFMYNNIAAAGAVDRELWYIEWKIFFPPTATTAGTATATTTNNNNNNIRCGGRSHHWRWKLKISFCHVWLAMLSLRPALQLQSSLSWFCLGLVLWSRMRMMTENVSNFSWNPLKKHRLSSSFNDFQRFFIDCLRFSSSFIDFRRFSTIFNDFQRFS